MKEESDEGRDTGTVKKKALCVQCRVRRILCGFYPFNINGNRKAKEAKGSWQLYHNNLNQQPRN